jgi:hypothetical protein
MNTRFTGKFPDKLGKRSKCIWNKGTPISRATQQKELLSVPTPGGKINGGIFNNHHTFLDDCAKLRNCETDRTPSF